MKKLILLGMFLPFALQAQTLRGLVTYTDGFHKYQPVPEFNATIEIYKYTDHTRQAYYTFSDALNTEIEYYQCKERYDYGRAAFGKRNDYTINLKKEMELKNINDETIDSLRNLSTKLWKELHSYEAIKNDHWMNVKTGVNGEYSIKLPPGKYYAYVKCPQGSLYKYIYFTINDNSDTIENFEF